MITPTVIQFPTREQLHAALHDLATGQLVEYPAGHCGYAIEQLPSYTPWKLAQCVERERIRAVQRATRARRSPTTERTVNVR